MTRDTRDPDPHPDSVHALERWTESADARCDDCGHPIWTDAPWSFAERVDGETVTIYCEDCAAYRGLEVM